MAGKRKAEDEDEDDYDAVRHARDRASVPTRCPFEAESARAQGLAKEATPQVLVEAQELARHAGGGDRTGAWAQQLVDLVQVQLQLCALQSSSHDWTPHLQAAAVMIHSSAG